MYMAGNQCDLDRDEWRRSNVGVLLNNALRDFESRVFEPFVADGHGELIQS